MKDVYHPIDEGFFPIQPATLDLLGLRKMKHDSSKNFYFLYNTIMLELHT
jgi:hypothetical protein